MSAHAVEALSFKVSPALDHAITRIGELARECGDLTRTVDKQRHEIALLKNKHIKPYRGCKLHEVQHGNASVVLEYEFDPAQRGDWDEPSIPASASVIRVWIGGHPFSYELFNEDTISQWEYACLSCEVSE
jgi:hypothetical protein